MSNHPRRETSPVAQPVSGRRRSVYVHIKRRLNPTGTWHMLRKMEVRGDYTCLHSSVQCPRRAVILQQCMCIINSTVVCGGTNLCPAKKGTLLWTPIIHTVRRSVHTAQTVARIHHTVDGLDTAVSTGFICV